MCDLWRRLQLTSRKTTLGFCELQNDAAEAAISAEGACPPFESYQGRRGCASGAIKGTVGVTADISKKSPVSQEKLV